MATLKRDKWENWIVRHRTGGRGSRLIYQNLGKMTHADAKERMKVLLAESDSSKTLADPNITFGRLSELWLKLHAKPILRPLTYAGDEGVVRLHLVPTFGAKRVRDILPIDVESYRTGIMAAKNAPAASTINLRLTLFGQILAWGASKKIAPNPIPPRTIKGLKEAESTIYFEPGEWRRFTAAADAAPHLAVTAPVWRLQLLTASRIGEMVGLTWGDVDFARKVLVIPQPKVSRPKTLRLSPDMERVLSGLTRGIGAAPVFLDARGHKWRTDRLDYFFHQILKAAGLDGGGAHGMFTTHSVRHSAATWARKAGAPLDRISGILGHHDMKMVLRYAHIEPEDLDGALGAVAKAAGDSVIVS